MGKVRSLNGILGYNNASGNLEALQTELFNIGKQLKAGKMSGLSQDQMKSLKKRQDQLIKEIQDIQGSDKSVLPKGTGAGLVAESSAGVGGGANTGLKIPKLVWFIGIPVVLIGTLAVIFRKKIF